MILLLDMHTNVSIMKEVCSLAACGEETQELPFNNSWHCRLGMFCAL